MPSHKRQRNETGSAATPPVVRDPLADAINYAGLHADVLLQLGDGADVWSDAVVVSNSPWEDCGRLRYHVFDLSGDDVPRLLRRALEFDRTRWVRLDVHGTSKALSALAALQPTNIDICELDGHCRDDGKAVPSEASDVMLDVFNTVVRLDMSTIEHLYKSADFLRQVLDRMPDHEEVRYMPTKSWMGVMRLWRATDGETPRDRQHAEDHYSVEEGYRQGDRLLADFESMPAEEAERELESLISRPQHCAAGKVDIAACKYLLHQRLPDSQFADGTGDELVEAFQQLDFISRKPFPLRFSHPWRLLVQVLQQKESEKGFEGHAVTVAGVSFTAREAFLAVTSIMNLSQMWLGAASAFNADSSHSTVDKLNQLIDFNGSSERIGRIECLRRAIFAEKDLDMDIPFARRLTMSIWLAIAKDLRRGEIINGDGCTIGALDCCKYALQCPLESQSCWAGLLETVAIHGDTSTTIMSPNHGLLGWRQLAERALAPTLPIHKNTRCRIWARVGYALPNGATLTVGGEELSKGRLCGVAQQLTEDIDDEVIIRECVCKAMLGVGCSIQSGRDAYDVEMNGEPLSALTCFAKAVEFNVYSKEAWAHLSSCLEADETVDIGGQRFSQADVPAIATHATMINWAQEEQSAAHRFSLAVRRALFGASMSVGPVLKMVLYCSTFARRWHGMLWY